MVSIITLGAMLIFTFIVLSLCDNKFIPKDTGNLRGSKEWKNRISSQFSTKISSEDENARESKQWWQKTIMYQIYPRSFKDSDGDGTGDLRGIIEKLDHFVDLGVETIWISPIYPSGGADNGYDVADFVGIDPLFGTMDDFDNLIEEAHARGIKILLDFVPNHSSDEHEWFKKSVDRIEPYTNYYIWNDGIYNKTEDKHYPPNNWLCVFGGGAWEWNEKRQQYYYHHFSVKQPDLNYRFDKLKEEMNNVLRFWLDKGIDGWRIDAMNHLYEDVQLRDEPYLPGYEGDMNYGHVDHIYTINQPELYDILVEWRALVDEYQATTQRTRIIVIEAYTSLNLTMQYYKTSKGQIGGHLPFNFQFVGLDTSPTINSNATDFARCIHTWMDNMPEGHTANWVFSNHDNHRVANRLGFEIADGMAMLDLLLPGVAVIYYGDEIGMRDHEWIRSDLRQDKNNAGADRVDESRDPERTPFQWDDSTNSGFSKAIRPWLPVNPNYWAINLKSEKIASWSTYKLFKALIDLRKTDTIIYGDYATQILNRDMVLVVRRMLQGHDSYIVLINFNAKPEEVVPGDIEGISSNDLYVVVPSQNSGYQIGERISQDFKTKIYLRPKASLVLIQTANGLAPKLDKKDQDSGYYRTSSASSKVINLWCLLLTIIVAFERYCKKIFVLFQIY